MKATLSIDQHSRMHSALAQADRLAAFTLASIRGRTAEEVAQEVVSRAVAVLKAKAEAGRAKP